MKANPLPKDADPLLALAEDVAALLSERRYQLGISIDVEARLRASISAATFGINTYLIVLADSRKSVATRGHLPEAKARCDRSIKQLRRGVDRSIAQFRRHLEDKDPLKAPVSISDDVPSDAYFGQLNKNLTDLTNAIRA
jgi:hypothetical protein